MTDFLKVDQARGRPVGTGIDGTGALLVADDAGNTVWRVAAADGSVTPQPIGTDQMPAATPSAANAVEGAPDDMPTARPSSQSVGGALRDQSPLNPSQTDIAPATEPD